MLTVPVYSLGRQEVGKIELPESIFKAELRKDILHQIVLWQLACRRAGTHSTKTKGMVRGGGKKPFKQKGTGEARQGTIRSPLMPGGGTAFGPMPRSYAYTLPKSVKKKGMAVALSYLLKEGRLWILEDLTSDGKTGNLQKVLKKFGVSKALLIDEKSNENMKRATRNLKGFKFLEDRGLNVYDLLKYNECLVTKKALQGVVERLGV